MPPGLFQRGSRISSGTEEGRWQVLRKLGEGQFAEVYEVRDTLARDKDARYAVKIDKRRDVKSVKQELRVLQRLQELAAQSVCQSIVTGTFEERSFIVMELLGPNLAESRLKVGGWLAPHVVRCVGLSTLCALQGMHEAGYLHRDVKPANFALFPPDSNMMQGVWKVIDFGLARRYTSEDSGALLPQRLDAAFRGSTTYASIHAHNEQDLGRRDDLWSWLYCLVELLDGTLPWRADATAAATAAAVGGAGAGAGGREGDPAASTSGRELRERVRLMKQQCVQQPSLLCRNAPLPEALLHISHHLNSLSFSDTPDYSFIRSCLLHLGQPQPQSQPQPQPQLQAPTHTPHPSAAPHTAGASWGYPPSQLPPALPLDYQPRAPEPPGVGVAGPSVRDTPLSPVRDTPLSPQAEGGGYGPPGEYGAVGQGSSPWRHMQGGGDLGMGGMQDPAAAAAAAAACEAQAAAAAAYEAQAAWEQRADQVVSEAAAAVQLGLLSPEAYQLQLRLKALPPVEALAVLAAVIQQAASSTHAAVGNIMAQTLGDLSIFTRLRAKQAEERFAEHCSKVEQGAAAGAGPGARHTQTPSS